MPEVNAENNFINADGALVSSCLARQGRGGISFTVTGFDTLPVLPYQRSVGEFSIAEVGNIENREVDTITSEVENPSLTATWKIGQKVVEAGGIIVIPNF